MKKNLGRYRTYRIVSNSKNYIGKKEAFLSDENGAFYKREGDTFVNVDTKEEIINE